MSVSNNCFQILFIYFQKKGKRLGKGRRQRGRETSMCKRKINQLPLAHPQLGTPPATQACSLTGNRTSNLLVHRPVLNPLSHTSQGNKCSFKRDISRGRCGSVGWSIIPWTKGSQVQLLVGAHTQAADSTPAQDACERATNRCFSLHPTPAPTAHLAKKQRKNILG